MEANKQTFSIGDILQDAFHVELNDGKFDPKYPTVFVKKITKGGNYICERCEVKSSEFRSDCETFIIAEPFKGGNGLVEHFVKIF